LRKSILYILWGGIFGVLLGALIDFLAFTVIPLREAIYGWLGYYMTYFPAFAILGGGLAGIVAALLILRNQGQ